MVANSGHYFLRPDEIIYDAAKSKDKTFAIEEGAVHGGGPCTQCAQALGLPPDYFGDTTKRTYDFMDEWLSEPRPLSTVGMFTTMRGRMNDNVHQ